MTVNEALEKSIDTLKKIRIPVSEMMEIGLPINDVTNTQINIRVALEPKKEESKVEEENQDKNA